MKITLPITIVRVLVNGDERPLVEVTTEAAMLATAGTFMMMPDTSIQAHAWEEVKHPRFLTVVYRSGDNLPLRTKRMAFGLHMTAAAPGQRAN